MHETIVSPNIAVQPLRKHHFAKQYGIPQTQVRSGGAIFTKSQRKTKLAASETTLPENSAGHKFWIVRDRVCEDSPIPQKVTEPVAAVPAPGRERAQIAMQTPPYPERTLPTYNHQAVALQPASPFLVPETASERNITSGDASALATMTFFEASARWKESHKSVVKEGTFVMLGQHIKMLNRYFRDMKLHKIHVGHMRDYQQARRENRAEVWKLPAGPSLINHEMSVVQQVLKMAKLWGPIADVYQPLPLPPITKKKVLDDAEEHHLFAVAASRPEWYLALLAARLTRNTTAAGCELRNLRFEDVILDAGEPRIVISSATAKNQFRGRTIPLNATALGTMRLCIERANKLGSHLPEHYIFPKRIVRGRWDPAKPASPAWITVPFRQLRAAAGFPWLTPHCFRHMAITVMLEKGSAPETVRQIAGHVSEQMMKHYSHNRHAAQMAVLQAMDSMPIPPKKKSSTAKAQQQRFMSRGRRRILQRRVTA
jgi:integrase